MNFRSQPLFGFYDGKYHFLLKIFHYKYYPFSKIKQIYYKQKTNHSLIEITITWILLWLIALIYDLLSYLDNDKLKWTEVRKENSFIHFMFSRNLTKYEGGCKARLTTHWFIWDFSGFSSASPISGTSLSQANWDSWWS